LFEGSVYAYEEDRKEQCGRTYSPVSIGDFLIHAEHQQIPIPEAFLRELTDLAEK
jgi:hypothetical protein